jgi:hypothetical protein
MLQLWSRRVKTYARLFMVMGLLQTTLIAKCISVQLALKGEIVGPTKDLTVVVEVASATEGDSNTEVRQKSSIEGSRFEVFAWFNTTSNIVSAETCDRSPHLVMVKLMKEQEILDRQTLTVEQDFHRTRSGGYKLNRAITLHRPADK